MWCRIAEAAAAKMPKANGGSSRYSVKLVTARFFMERMLPETATHLARIQAGAGSMMEVPDEGFLGLEFDSYSLNLQNPFVPAKAGTQGQRTGFLLSRE